MRSRGLTVLPLLFVFACTRPAPPNPITAEGILADVRALSDDSFEGRGPGTDADRRARAWIAERLSAIGFSPGAADGSWEQPVPLVGVDTKPPEAWTFRGKSAEVSFRPAEDFMINEGPAEPEVSLPKTEVVFVGYGIRAPEENWDDFKGVDVRGKVVLMLNNDPDWDPALFAGTKRLYYGRWTYKFESAAHEGAAGAILIHTDESAGYGWNVVRTSWSGPQFELAGRDGPRCLVKGWLTEEAANRMVALGGFSLADLVAKARSRDFRPVPLGVTTAVDLAADITRVDSANVIGVLDGHDDALASEAVLYTAHHDHLGIGPPDETGDTIYNGALDNAAGVAQVLSIANAFAHLPARPKRTVVALFVAGEEQGLLGSQYYAEHPTFPRDKIVAEINIDGGNIFGRTKDVAVIGYGKSTLEDLLKDAATAQDRVVVPEPEPDKGYYYRSDQINFARIGIPSLYFKSGFDYRDRPQGWGKEQSDQWRRERYHQPSDEIYEAWDLSGMAEDAALAFEVGRKVAFGEATPSWYPGDEFAAMKP